MGIDPDVEIELAKIRVDLQSLRDDLSGLDDRLAEARMLNTLDHRQLADSVDGLATELAVVVDRLDRLDSGEPSEPEPAGYFRPSILANIRTATPERQAAVTRAQSRSFANPGRQPSPVDIVRWAGAGNQQYVTQNGLAGQQQGGELGIHNATCALVNSLLWLAGEGDEHRDCAIRILDGWSAVHTEIAFDQPRRIDNNGQVWDRGLLYAGWAGCMFARAGAALVAGEADWPNVDRARVWLRDVHGPLVRGGWTQGANWILTSAQACIEIGQFAESPGLVDDGIRALDDRLDQCIYLTSDGAFPPPQASWWSDPPRQEWGLAPGADFVNGQNQEMGADLYHAMMGLGAAVIAVDCAGLWDRHGDRIATALETFAGFLNAHLDGQTPPPGWPCTRFVTGTNGVDEAWGHSWDVGHRQLITVEDRDLPELARFAARVRPDAVAMHLSYTSLTHGP